MADPHSILSRIDCPRDLQSLPVAMLRPLAAEIRRLIMEVVAANGGHLASNLGVVELTIALHRVFSSPKDKIVWDVGHQCYAHKILTGRREAFSSLRTWGGISGFPKRAESEHDIVETGHASTAISSCLGIAVGQERLGVRGKVIAVVGDGALSGGLALAGLNHAGHMRKNLIIVLNDNEMSIGSNVGALSAYLSGLSTTRVYQAFRRGFDRTVSGLPLVGPRLMGLISRMKKGLKAVFYRESLFADLGYEYVGPIDGHDLSRLIRIFTNLKNLEGPVVVHVTTRKGKGYPFAEENPTRYHGVAPFSLLDGRFENSSKLTFSEAFAGAIGAAVEADKRIVAVTAAMADGTGLRPLKEANPERVFDVGIAEEHAVTFSAGMAIAGLRPVVAIYSTFMQRALDQVIHDVAIPRLPVIFALDRAGLVAGDGETHQGIFDISIFSAVPGLAILAPANRSEMELSLRWALERHGPVMIRYPKAVCAPEFEELKAPLEEGRGAFVRHHHSEVLLMALGGILPEVLKATHILNLRGISSDVYSVRFVKPLDGDYIRSIISLYSRVVLVEEAAQRGGFGEHIAGLLRGDGSLWFRWLALPDSFPSHGSRADLLRACALDGESIARRVEEFCMEPVDARMGLPASSLTSAEGR
jgi:1-deoxy-D-xylulose-5-phosphate synthase